MTGLLVVMVLIEAVTSGQAWGAMKRSDAQIAKTVYGRAKAPTLWTRIGAALGFKAPARYIAGYELNKSKALLAETQRKINEINKKIKTGDDAPNLARLREELEKEATNLRIQIEEQEGPGARYNVGDPASLTKVDVAEEKNAFPIATQISEDIGALSSKNP